MNFNKVIKELGFEVEADADIVGEDITNLTTYRWDNEFYQVVIHHEDIDEWHVRDHKRHTTISFTIDTEEKAKSLIKLL